MSRGQGGGPTQARQIAELYARTERLEAHDEATVHDLTMLLRDVIDLSDRLAVATGAEGRRHLRLVK